MECKLKGPSPKVPGTNGDVLSPLVPGTFGDAIGVAILRSPGLRQSKHWTSLYILSAKESL